MQQNNPFQNKVVKSKKLGKTMLIEVSFNEISKRIFVDFSSIDGKLRLQRSFQDTFEGKQEAKNFEKSLKSLNDLKKHFGLK